MSFSTCTISGTVTDATGAAVVGAWIRISIGAQPSWGYDLGQPYFPPMYRRSADGLVFGDDVVVATPQVINSTTGGAFSVVVPQGATIRVEIPSADIDHVGTVPAQATAAFSDLFNAMQRWNR